MVSNFLGRTVGDVKIVKGLDLAWTQKAAEAVRRTNLSPAVKEAVRFHAHAMTMSFNLRGSDEA